MPDTKEAIRPYAVRYVRLWCPTCPRQRRQEPDEPQEPIHPEVEARLRLLLREELQAVRPVSPPVAVPSAVRPVPPRVTEASGYDAAKFYVGKLCPQRHEYGTTGKTLRRRSTNQCPTCKEEQRKARRAQAHGDTV